MCVCGLSAGLSLVFFSFSFCVCVLSLGSLFVFVDVKGNQGCMCIVYICRKAPDGYWGSETTCFETPKATWGCGMGTGSQVLHTQVQPWQYTYGVGGCDLRNTQAAASFLGDSRLGALETVGRLTRMGIGSIHGARTSVPKGPKCLALPSGPKTSSCLRILFFFPPSGFKGNLSLLDILFSLSSGLKQMEDHQTERGARMAPSRL